MSNITMRVFLLGDVFLLREIFGGQAWCLSRLYEVLK